MDKKLLIFGGNGMMGYETLRILLERGYRDIVLVNRGRSWDWDKKESLLPAIKSVKSVKWNRAKPLTDCQELVDIVNNCSAFDAVLDFSGYHKFGVEQAADLVKGKVGIYIYISTDSVYEVCENPGQAGPTQEEHDVRPTDEEVSGRLQEEDKYGHEKLECEETLRRYWNLHKLPFVALRLADVIGPRDGTDRWLQYQLWAKTVCCSDLRLPLLVPSKLKTKPISVVYSVDVANLVVDIATNIHNNQTLFGKSFNLSCEETPVVATLLRAMKAKLGLADLKIEYSSDEDVPQMYPSVERGPIDITKAKCVLNWQPTPLATVVENTVIFYAEAMEHDKFNEEKESCMQGLLNDLKSVYPEEYFVDLETAMKIVLCLS